jgi:hypothetical protein
MKCDCQSQVAGHPLYNRLAREMEGRFLAAIAIATVNGTIGQRWRRSALSLKLFVIHRITKVGVREEGQFVYWSVLKCT